MDIVVTGVGIVSALGIGAKCNLASICTGTSGISTTPHILKTGNSLPVGELRVTNAELHAIAGISAKEHLSRTALLGILAVREALADADINPSDKTGLVSATSVGGMDLTELFFSKFVDDNATGRLRNVKMHDCAASTYAIAKHCNIGGYSTTISTACSSAANAIIAGARLLRHNRADCVVVGGCDALSAFTLNGFKSLMILDKNQCRPFDATRAGLNLGEGAGFIVLQRKKDVARYYCRLVGYANSNDAFHQTASSVNGEGAYIAMSRALGMAAIDPRQVTYINAHGTGTQNNDASESAAFIRLFGDNVPPFSSTKAFTGHTLAAAGGIEAALSAIAIKEGYLYPNLNFGVPIEDYGLVPLCKFRQGMNVNCVLTNSFGFGGNCTSLVFAK